MVVRSSIIRDVEMHWQFNWRINKWEKWNPNGHVYDSGNKSVNKVPRDRNVKSNKMNHQ